MKTVNYLPLLFCLLANYLFSQSNIEQALSVNGTGAAADASAQLDVSATDKGMLVPRMTTAQRTLIASPAMGLLVYDTDTGSFWFHNGTAWAHLMSGANGWSLGGNAAAPADFIGTTNNEGLLFKANNQQAGKIDLANSNTFWGLDAGFFNTTGSSNTAYGTSTLHSNTTGFNNTANGVQALYSNTTGNSNNANGINALYANTTGNYNSANGTAALYANTTGNSNTATGTTALYSNTTGVNNTATGTDALYANTTGYYNTATGTNVLSSNLTGFNNTASGVSALYSNTTGYNNTANGAAALRSNTTGINNTANGGLALYANTTGFNNVANGASALTYNTTGSYNTANGMIGLYHNTTGNNNTANGHAALYSNTTGINNTANGKDALYSNTTGNGNTGRGEGADVSAGNLTNATAIGYAASVNASNKVRLGNSAVAVIEGQVAYTFPSDARFKFNVQDETVPGLAFIEKLRPVTYQFDTRKFNEHLMKNMPNDVQQRRMEGQDYSESTALVQTGFLAQEVEQACKDLNFSFSGLHVPASDVDNYGLAYGSFVPLLVKAVQEQQQIIEHGKWRMEKLEAENAALKAQLETERTANATRFDKITAALADAGIMVEK